MGYLFGLENRIHRYEHRTGCRRPETAYHRLEALVEVDCDPIATRQPQRRQTRRELPHGVPKLLIGQRPDLAGQGAGMR